MQPKGLFVSVVIGVVFLCEAGTDPDGFAGFEVPSDVYMADWVYIEAVHEWESPSHAPETMFEGSFSNRPRESTILVVGGRYGVENCFDNSFIG